MTDEQKKLLTEYISEAKITGHRESAITGLKNRALKVFEYTEEKGITLNQIGIKEAQAYQGWIMMRGKRKGINYKNSSVKPYITAVVSFFKFLERKKIVYANPFLEIKRLPIELTLPKNILKEKEMNMFLKELSMYEKEKKLKTKATLYKVHVIAELMYSTGLRMSEVANLRIEDIDYDRGVVNVIEGKGGESRIAFLNEYSQKVLRIYIDKMRDLVLTGLNKEKDRLFGINRNGFEKTVNKKLKQVSKRLGLGNFTSHGFRHALATHLLRAGCDIRHIQAILGHKRLKNTEIYTKVEKEDLKKIFDKHHPRTFLKKK